MAELNLKQIIDRLNEEFIEDTRKLVFWYEDKGKFADTQKRKSLRNILWTLMRMEASQRKNFFH